jgi:vesicle-fusing ATPase
MIALCSPHFKQYFKPTQAILRPGRFEIHIEISLPDEEGRFDIFNIHLRKWAEAGFLGPEVTPTALRRLARETPMFTGAEIAGCIRDATSKALHRIYGAPMRADDDDEEQDVKRKATESLRPELTLQDIEDALETIDPANGKDLSRVKMEERFLRYGLLRLAPPDTATVDTHVQVIDQLDRRLNQLRFSATTNKLQVLLYGAAGTGKTGLAAHFALNSKLSFFKFLSAENMVGYTETKRIEMIEDAFVTAYSRKIALIVLDGFDGLAGHLQLNANQHSVNKNFVHNIHALLDRAPPRSSKLMILITANAPRSALQSALGVWHRSTIRLEVPRVAQEGAAAVMDQLAVVRADRNAPFEFPSDLTIALRDLLVVVENLRFDFDLDLQDKIENSEFGVDADASIWDENDPGGEEETGEEEGEEKEVEEGALDLGQLVEVMVPQAAFEAALEMHGYFERDVRGGWKMGSTGPSFNSTTAYAI